MRSALAFLRSVAAFLIGVFTAMAVIAFGRQLAFGHGFAVSPVDLHATAQLIVVVAWFVGAAGGTWLAIRLARGSAAGLVVCAWLFQMVWLSPGVRPAELEMRLVCAVAVALAGFGLLISHRIADSRNTRAART